MFYESSELARILECEQCSKPFGANDSPRVQLGGSSKIVCNACSSSAADEVAHDLIRMFVALKPKQVSSGANKQDKQTF